MRLGLKQELFAECYALLIFFALSKGYKVRLGEVQRSPEEAARNAEQGDGISNSLHTLCLAGDVKLFKDGKYLTESEDYRELGEFWKKLHVLNCWGGDFKDAQGRPKPDGGHFSVTHGGVK